MVGRGEVIEGKTGKVSGIWKKVLESILKWRHSVDDLLTVGISPDEISIVGLKGKGICKNIQLFL